MTFQQMLDNGDKFFNEKKYFRAHIMYMGAIKQCPIEDNISLSKIYTKLSSTQYAMKKVDEAIQSATKAIQSDTSNSDAYHQRAVIFEDSQNWRDSLRDYQSASNLDPENQNFVEKIKFIQEQIEIHKNSGNNDNDNEPIPRFTENFAQDVVEEMLNGNRPSRRVASEIVKCAFDIFSDLPNIVDIDVKNIIIVGDVHGQFHDVAEIFKTHGFPSEERPYLFNGDFVDRGNEGIEVLISLFSWKIANPKSIFLTRGNHESSGMNKLYGFQDECVEKYGIALYKHIESVFEALPLGYIINKQLFVVHGGLFQDQTITIPALQKLNRFQETPMNGPMHDILWSDPMDTEGFESSGRCDNGQTKNFGTDVTEKFLRENGLRLLIRSHQVQNDGFSITQNGKCITVFSAPNYMGKVGNLGALLKISFDESGQMGDVEFVKFDSVQPFGSTSNQTKKGEEIDTNQPNEENI